MAQYLAFRKCPYALEKYFHSLPSTGPDNIWQML